MDGTIVGDLNLNSANFRIDSAGDVTSNTFMRDSVLEVLGVLTGDISAVDDSKITVNDSGTIQGNGGPGFIDINGGALSLQSDFTGNINASQGCSVQIEAFNWSVPVLTGDLSVVSGSNLNMRDATVIGSTFMNRANACCK